MKLAREYEGTWEEVAAHAEELAGHRVRLTVISEPEKVPPPPPAFRPGNGPSTAVELLKHVGTWVGDDLQECLDLVYATRSKAKF